MIINNFHSTFVKINPNRLSKKRKRPQTTARDASVHFVTLTVFSKPAKESHLKLRERTLLRHRPKLFSFFQQAAFNTAPRGHSVEFTDDVFVWDAQGKRIPRIIVPVERLP